MDHKAAIGIDLGSSKCCVGVVRDGKVEIIENERGNKTTPSYVAFTDTERLIGEDAKDQATLNPTNTVFGVKRIMGRKGDDPIVAVCSKHSPYFISSDNSNKARIHGTYKNSEKVFIPEQITAMLLTKMKEMAETHLGFEVHDAVISVPACFTNAQRQATKDAAQIAGLNVLRLINEPTAAAIAYEANRRTDAAETVVVVDFGGGKLDVSVIKVKKGNIEVAVHNGVQCGGSDIDEVLLEHFMSEFYKKNDKIIAHNGKPVERLRTSSEKVKKTLSVLPNAQDKMDCLSDDIDFDMFITTEEFNEICTKKLCATLKDCVKQALRSSNLYAVEIDKVVLVGGSTRLPFVQHILQEIFSKAQLDRSVNPDEAVAYGAAVQAALLAGDHTLQDVAVADVTSSQFTIVSSPGYDMNQLWRFSRLPYTVYASNFGLAPYRLYEACCASDATTYLLDEMYVKNSSDFPVRNSFVLEVDQDGILHAHVSDEYDEWNFSIRDKSRLFSKPMPAMVREEQRYRRDAAAERQRVAAMTDLEAYCFQQQTAVQELFRQGKVDEETRDDVTQKCQDIIGWIDRTPEAGEAECHQKKCKLKVLLSRYLVLLDEATNGPEGHTREINPLQSQSYCNTKIGIECCLETDHTPPQTARVGKAGELCTIEACTIVNQSNTNEAARSSRESYSREVNSGCSVCKHCVGSNFSAVPAGASSALRVAVPSSAPLKESVSSRTESVGASGTESVCTSGTESVRASGTEGIGASGTESVCTSGTEGVCASGTESVYTSGTEGICVSGEESVCTSGMEGVCASGTESVRASGTESICALGADSGRCCCNILDNKQEIYCVRDAGQLCVCFDCVRVTEIKCVRVTGVDCCCYDCRPDMNPGKLECIHGSGLTCFCTTCVPDRLYAQYFSAYRGQLLEPKLCKDLNTQD